MLALFHYTFLWHGLLAGVLLAIIAPLIGIFLVLRRYALIADTLAHVSLAGVAIGLFLKLPPLLTAMGAGVISALAMERLRVSQKTSGETALALFLSGGLALFVVLTSLARGFNSSVLSYLFGSLLTVTTSDLYTITLLGLVVLAVVGFFYKELVAVTFDEETARVNGLPVDTLNIIFMILTALTVALAIPIVGVLLISALLVIPVVTALQLKKNFKQTLVAAELFSLGAVISGLIISFYANLAAGGTIVLVSLGFFLLVLLSQYCCRCCVKNQT